MVILVKLLVISLTWLYIRSYSMLSKTSEVTKCYGTDYYYNEKPEAYGP